MSEQYYNKISVNHYKSEVDGSVTGSFRPADIGWRSVDDELPDENVSVVFDMDDEGDTYTAYYKKHGDAITWYSDIDDYIVDVTQWYKMPPPPKAL